MTKKLLLIIFSFTIFSIVHAQNVITGTVVDEAGEPISFSSIREKNTDNGTVADGFGNFMLTVKSSNPTLAISAIGYVAKEFAFNKNDDKYILAKSSKSLDGIQVVGSRNSSRTKLNSLVPVDVINIREVTSKNGQLDLNQLLQYVAPSFNSNRQSGSDGADHIDPATLRGLGPDQTLVLLNGKRYHQSSLVNLYGSRGRGNNGTDLNTIPAAAIERIEILRDGAAAQYGSDAIAGVINIVLKSSANNLTFNVGDGAYTTRYNRNGKSFDGNNFNVNGNYGFKLLKKGFGNITLDYNTRAHTNRAATHPDSLIARREFGDASSNNVSLFLNSALPVSTNSEVYLFGGSNLRSGKAFAWTRFAEDDRNDTSIYPNGFDPIITSNIVDYSATLGFRTSLKNKANLDISGTTGANRFHYGVENTLNRSLGSSSPTTFDAGGFGLAQTTLNVDYRKKIASIAEGLNIAFGGEYRIENYNIFAGEEKSYKRYDTIHAPGSQGFPGFQPGDATNKGRNSQALYTDIELKATEKWDVEGALRFENYSDFGQALTWKVATRYDLARGYAVRACVNTGFRAPSLPQKYFNSTITNFVAGNAVDVLIARNDGPVATALGIPSLKKETSINYSAGIILNPIKNFSVTVDGYYIRVRDRIVLTGQFLDSDSSIGSLLSAQGVGRAQLFTNAVSTATQGLDVVGTYVKQFSKSKMNFMLAANLNRLNIIDIYTNNLLAGKEDTYFDMREKYFLRASAPPSKITFATDFIYKKLSTTLRFTRFGKVTLANWHYDENKLDIYDPRMTTDLSFTYKASNALQLTLGSSNLFNVYPKLHDPLYTESGGAWDPLQMGYNGRFIFAKARWNMNRD